MSYSIFSLRSFGYFIYSILLIVVLLYVRFPVEKFTVYCEKRVEGFFPDSQCNIGRIAYRFPLSASFDTIKISRVINGKETDLVVDRLVLSPESLKFWKNFKLEGEMYSGRFEAGLSLDTETQSFHLVDMHLEGVEAGALTRAFGLTEREITGSLEFSGNYQAPMKHPGDGTGKGVVQFSSGSMSFLLPLLSLSTLEFEKVAANYVLENGILSLAQGELQGTDMNADFAGEVRIASPWLDSNIQLIGHLQLSEAFLRSHPREQQIVQRLLQRFKMKVLSFRLGGTVKRPLFRFST
jgi:type II secretion system protein N